MPSTFFTSDTHFGHRLMTRLRGFAPDAASSADVTAEEVTAHDAAIIDAWNRHVRPGDVVWHLGDVTLLRARRVTPLLEQLRGSIRVVLGNHDRAHPLFGERSIREMEELLKVSTVAWAGTFAAVKIPATREATRRNGSVPHRVVLSHFPYDADHTDDPRETQWRLRDEGAVLLHGHTHSASATKPGMPRQIHVGWDTWGRPVAAHEIAEIIEAPRV